MEFCKFVHCVSRFRIFDFLPNDQISEQRESWFSRLLLVECIFCSMRCNRLSKDTMDVI